MVKKIVNFLILSTTSLCASDIPMQVLKDIELAPSIDELSSIDLQERRSPSPPVTVSQYAILNAINETKDLKNKVDVTKINSQFQLKQLQQNIELLKTHPTDLNWAQLNQFSDNCFDVFLEGNIAKSFFTFQEQKYYAFLFYPSCALSLIYRELLPEKIMHMCSYSPEGQIVYGIEKPKLQKTFVKYCSDMSQVAANNIFKKLDQKPNYKHMHTKLLAVVEKCSLLLNASPVK